MGSMKNRRNPSRVIMPKLFVLAVLFSLFLWGPVSTAEGKTFVVNSTADTGELEPCATETDEDKCTLRGAINSANQNVDKDTILFAIPISDSETGAFYIRPKSRMSDIIFPVIIDGYSQPGAIPSAQINDVVLKIVLDGIKLVPSSGLFQSINGLVLFGGDSIVKGLVIQRFSDRAEFANGFGILMKNKGRNRIEGNFIGTDVTGMDAQPNDSSGIRVFGTSGGNRIRGNLLSGNGTHGLSYAVDHVGGDFVEGNYIGIDRAGTKPLPNARRGIFISSPNNTIGGLTADKRNIISGYLFSTFSSSHREYGSSRIHKLRILALEKQP